MTESLKEENEENDSDDELDSQDDAYMRRYFKDLDIQT